jgi:hypothetical protein
MTEDNPAIQHFGTGRSVEEYQAFGGFKDGKWTGTGHTDEVNIWIGVDESGECYIGVAGRTAPMFNGARYFTTAGFQRITREDYDALRAVPVFQKVKGD